MQQQQLDMYMCVWRVVVEYQRSNVFVSLSVHYWREM